MKTHEKNNVNRAKGSEKHLHGCSATWTLSKNPIYFCLFQSCFVVYLRFRLSLPLLCALLVLCCFYTCVECSCPGWSDTPSREKKSIQCLLALISFPLLTRTEIYSENEIHWFCEFGLAKGKKMCSIGISSHIILQAPMIFN